jgi:glycosyltransferase involved in cell wall biosynthesis
MKIALLTNGIYPYIIGGMQKHSYYLTKYLAQSGIEIDLYHFQCNHQYDISELECFDKSEKELINSIVIDKPKRKYFPGHYILESKNYSEKVFEVLRSRLNVDFIYAKSFSAWKLLIEREKGLITPPIGINFHGYEMFQVAPSSPVVGLQQFMLKFPVLFNVKRADHIFSYGGKINQLIANLGVDSKKIIEISAGVDSSWLKDIRQSAGPRRFVFMGRYERRKGIEELTDVIQKIANLVEFQFCFIGAIPEYLKIKHRNIKYYGLLSESEQIQSVLNDSDILVCPSYSEGMPNVILEGMASGLAIIATDVGAVNKMVSLENGWLISPGSKQQLHNALISAIHMSDEELTFKKLNSHLTIRNKFTWDRVVQKTLAELTKAVEKP